MRKITHIGEETEEHLEAENTQTQISLPEAPPQEKQTVNIGPYFAAGVIGLAIVIFLVFKFLRKKEKENG